jgi:D-tyrosyl-tRNA(Tyr) deacylase
VKEASVTVSGRVKTKICHGLVIFLGIEEEDDQTDIDWLAAKITRLRIFDDEEGVMNLSVHDTGGEIIVVSQFTLHASTKKGNRPSYIKAARPDIAIPLYESFIEKTEELTGKSPGTGEFGAKMDVALVNSGPVTIWIDTKKRE